MTSQPENEVDRILLRRRQSHIEAVKAGDVATIVSLFCADAVFMPPNETSLFGTAELTEWWQEYFEYFRVATFSETERDVTVFDGYAIERWSYMIVIEPVKAGDRIRDDGRLLALWKKEADGEWRMFQVMFNSIRPVGSGTSRFLSRLKTDG